MSEFQQKETQRKICLQVYLILVVANNCRKISPLEFEKRRVDLRFPSSYRHVSEHAGTFHIVFVRDPTTHG